MKTVLEASCDIKLWSDLPIHEQFRLQLLASNDPVFFFEDPHLGNMKLWESQKKILKSMYVIGADYKRLKSELIFISGRRGGKTTIAALITLYEIARMLFMESPQAHYNLTPNAEIFCINVAPSYNQALDTVFARVKELLANSPFFMAQIPYVTADTVRFPKHLTIKALGSSVSSGVGRTVKCFTADEVSSFEDTDQHSPEEIYFKMGNSTSNFKKWNEDIRIAISSIAEAGDFITSLYKQAEKEEWAHAELLWNKTWELNPELSWEVLEDERKRNPDIFDRDYGSEEPTAVKSFFTGAHLSLLIEQSKLHLNIFTPDPPIDRAKRKLGFIPDLDEHRLDISMYPDALEWYIIGDPSIKHDAFGLSVCYLNAADEIIFVGCTAFISQKGKEIDIEAIKAIFHKLFTAFPFSMYLFDNYMHTELHGIAKSYSVIPVQHNVNLNDYIQAKNDLFESKAKVPDSPYLFKEYAELKLINGRKVDHPDKGSKDVSDTTAQGISFIRRRQLEESLEHKAVPSFYAATY